MKLYAVTVKPFLKWAGGKTQLLPRLTEKLPPEMKFGAIKRYAEPFLGGGAMFFHLAPLSGCREFWLSDINPELILCYQTVKRDVKSLMVLLEETQSRYWQASEAEQEKIFYDTRTNFNAALPGIDFAAGDAAGLRRTAQIIFLNRTCFNGLFRVNGKGLFNVPFGRYRRPSLYEKQNLLEVSALLQDAQIQCGDFTMCEDFVDEHAFCYFDPPYRPLNKTASFTSYSKLDFTDSDQKRLADFARRLDQRGAKVMLSNSDPKNVNPQDDYFEQLYQGFNIAQVQAMRAINSNGAKRGAISELIITNY